MRFAQPRSSRKTLLLALSVVVALGVAGAAIGIALAGGNGDSEPTTGAFAPITVPRPLVAKAGGVVLGDPDSMIRQNPDMQTILARGSGPRHYRLTVSNISSLGLITGFEWFPPAGIQIVKITGTSSGSCKAAGTNGLGGSQFQNVVLNPEISCTGISLRPPSCTCRDDGGSVTISFVASAEMGLAGATRVVSAKPTVKIIPSYVQTPDLPECARGQVSTKASPCASD